MDLDTELDLTMLDLCTYYVFDEDDEETLSQVVDQIKNIPINDNFQSKDEQIDFNNPKDLEAVYSDGKLEKPNPGEYNAFLYNFDKDVDLHIHSSIQQNALSWGFEPHEMIWDTFGTPDMTTLRVFFVTSGDVEALSVSFDFPFDYEEPGFEFEYNGNWFGFREREGEIKSTLRKRYGDSGDIDEDSLEEFVENHVDIGEEVIDRINT